MAHFLQRFLHKNPNKKQITKEIDLPLFICSSSSTARKTAELAKFNGLVISGSTSILQRKKC